MTKNIHQEWIERELHKCERTMLHEYTEYTPYRQRYIPYIVISFDGLFQYMKFTTESAAARETFKYLITHMNNRNFVHAGYQELSRCCSCSTRTVARALLTLEKGGLITIYHHNNNVYCLINRKVCYGSKTKRCPKNYLTLKKEQVYVKL